MGLSKARRYRRSLLQRDIPVARERVSVAPRRRLKHRATVGPCFSGTSRWLGSVSQSHTDAG